MLRVLLAFVLLPAFLTSSELCLHHDSNSPLLLVSKLDGKISAISLSDSFREVWELDLGHPLLSASTNMAFKDNCHLIPSLDGNLYSMSRDGPTQTISPYAKLESLLNRRVEPGAQSRWVGGKVVTTRGVSPADGKVLYQCNIENCQRYNDSTVGTEPMLAITDETKTVRLLDMRLGVETWNWSISSVEMQYMGVAHRSSCLPPHLPVQLGFDVERGIISGLFDSGIFDTIQLDGPLSQAWVLNDEHLQPINMFHLSEQDTSAISIYLGQWNGMYYLQPFLPQDSLAGIDRINKEIFRLGWDVMQGVHGKYGRDTISWQHPVKDSTTAIALHNPAIPPELIGKVWQPRTDYIPPPMVQLDLDTGEDQDQDWSFWTNLAHDMAVTALLAAVIGYVVYRKVFKRKPAVSHISTETDERVMCQDGSRSPPSSPLAKQTVFNFDSVPSQQPFESRFEQDFEVIRVLGEGGFGKVLEAKHRISEHNYAIKVITLRRDDQKVEREVAAMAKLEHPNILRYFTSWKEMPTKQWTRSRKFTQSSSFSESFVDSGTESKSFSWSRSKSNRDTNIKIDDETTSIRGPVVDDSYSGIVFADLSSQVNGGNHVTDVSDSLEVVFANGTQSSGLPIAVRPTRSYTRTSLSWDSNDTAPEEVTSEARDTILYIQMELCSDQTLKEWLLDTPDRSSFLAIFSQIVDAVAYIHSHNHIHRDLKPSNILFSTDGRVKVADFGLATAMTHVIASDSGIGLAAAEAYEGPSLTRNLGTRLYMSPELETDSHYDYKVDIFALGVILFEMLTVFGTGSERVERVLELRRSRSVPACVDYSFPKYKVILLQMIALNPADRPTAAEVRSFFSNSDCDQIDFSSNQA